MIRYTLFALKEGGVPVPYWLHWLRYSAFTVLYPVGITSELVEMYLAYSGPAGHRAQWAPWVIAAYSCTYIPCKELFTHTAPDETRLTRLPSCAASLFAHGHTTQEAARRRQGQRVCKRKGEEGSIDCFAWNEYRGDGKGHGNVISDLS